MSARVSLRVLGMTSAELDGTTVDIGGRRQRAVLARLVIARGEVVTTERMVDDLWSGQAPAGGIGTLQVYVSNLRKALEPDRAPREPALVLCSAANGYLLRLPREAVDCWSFEDAVRATADLPVARARDVLTDALASWQGPAFAEYSDEPWAAAEIARLNELRHTARERLVECMIDLDEAATAAAEAVVLVETEPLREEGWRLLALAQYVSGRQSEALASLRRAREMFADELGLSLGPALAALQRSILQQAIPLPRTVSTAGTASTASDVARSASTRRGRKSAPPRLTVRVLGRDADIDWLVRMLRDEQRRLVTIVGPGGTGTTTLAISACAQFVDDFSEIAFIELSNAARLDAAWQVLAEALGADQVPDRSLETAVLDALPRGRALLVLDNVEQIAGADILVTALLNASSDLSILVTSRRALTLVGEAEYPLTPLALPSGDDVKSINNSPAVQCFTDRARLVRPDFSVTVGNAQSVVELCRRLDGLPLGLELAAAQLRIFGLSALLARLDLRMEEPQRAANRPDRQHSLAATIAWSYDQLDEVDRLVFRWLGVFAGEVDLPGVATVLASVVAEELILGAVTRLAIASLIRINEGSDGEPRISMLQTMRDSASDYLSETGEVNPARQAHIQWVDGEARRAILLTDGPNQSDGLARLSELADDVRSALERGFAAGELDPVALSSAKSLLARLTVWPWRRYGGFIDPRWVEAAVRLAAQRDSDENARLLWGAGNQILTHEPERAVGLLRAAAEMMDRVGDTDGPVGPRLLEAVALWSLDRAAEAKTVLLALDAAPRALLRPPTITSWLARVHLALGEDREALLAAERAGREFAEFPIDAFRAKFEAATLRTMAVRNEVVRIFAVLAVRGPQHASDEFITWSRNLHEEQPPQLLADAVELAAAMCAESNPAMTARLLGALHAFREEPSRAAKVGRPVLITRWRDIARAAITEADWTAAFDDGRTLSLFEALGLVQACDRH